MGKIGKHKMVRYEPLGHVTQRQHKAEGLQVMILGLDVMPLTLRLYVTFASYTHKKDSLPLHSFLTSGILQGAQLVTCFR